MSDEERWDVGGDPRVQAGLEHLQRAAREVISASRALLDVAEELVDDPRSAAGIADLLAGFASRLPRAGAADGVHDGPWTGVDHDDDDEDEPPVQRIPVS